MLGLVSDPDEIPSPVIDRDKVANGSSHANTGLLVPMAAGNSVKQLLE